MQRFKKLVLPSSAFYENHVETELIFLHIPSQGPYNLEEFKEWGLIHEYDRVKVTF